MTNAVKHFASHEISRHAFRFSQEPRASAQRLMCEQSIHKNPKTYWSYRLKMLHSVAR